MDPNYLHIIYASDRNFAPMLGISLVSLLENNRDIGIKLYILDNRIPEEDRRKMEDVCHSFGVEKPCWIPAHDISGVLGMNISVDRGSIAQYARVFISRNIDEGVDRLLYLDCDTIIRKPLKDLWCTDLKGNTIAALKDAFSVYYRANVGLQPSDIMFNSGVMLIDLDKWRERAVERRVLDFVRDRQGFVEKGDQGALNAVLSHECMCIDPMYNAVTIFFDFSYQEMLDYRRPPDYYSEEEVKRAVADPAIIHYTLSFLSKRPWMKDCTHPWRQEWLKYKEKSPWKDFPFQEEKRSWRVHVMRKLPRRIMLWLAGLLQVYGRPLLYRLRLRKLRKN